MISAALPALLLGTALVAVPIVLHLLMRQQPKHLEFPPLRFIVQREMANKRRLRLRHLLLLLLRCAIVAFLAFALARVRLNASGLGDAEAPVAAAIIVDSSPRMQYRHDNATRLEQAKEMAGQLLKELPAESDVAVLDAQYGSGSFAIDRGAADQRIVTLKPAAVVQPLSGVLEEAVRLVDKSPHARKEIYIFTDLARSAWPAAASDELKQMLDEHKSLGLYLVDIGVREPTNWSLGDVRMKAQVLSRNQPLLLETSLACQGGGGERLRSQAADHQYVDGVDGKLDELRQAHRESDGHQREKFTPPGCLSGAQLDGARRCHDSQGAY